MKYFLSFLSLIWMSCLSMGQFSDVSFLYEPIMQLDHCFPIDIDDDGDNDLVMSLSNGTVLGVTRQVRPDVMGKLEAIESSNHPISEFFSADVNADGVADLLSFSAVNHKLTANLVTSDGLGDEVVLLIDMPELIRLQMVDLDGNGCADVTYATSDAVMVHYIGFSLAVGQPSEVVNPLAEITAYRFGNTDLDVDDDLVIGTTEFIQVYPRNALGVFVPGFVFPSSANASRIELLHVTGTLAREIFWSASSLNFAVNNSGNTFGPSVTLISNQTSSNWSLDAFDGDGDGDLDLLLGRRISASQNQILFYFNNAGVFQASQNTFNATISGGQFRRLDMNGDGTLDYLILTPIEVSTNDFAFICYHDSPITLTAAQTHMRVPYYPYHKHTSNGWKMELGDMDGDGDLDIALASMRRLVWYSNNGSGQFNEPPMHIDYAPTGITFGDIWLHDFDGDGDLDVNFGDTYVNDGLGNFSEESLTLPPSRYADDLNYDGIIDYFMLTNTQARVWLGNSDGTHWLITSNHNLGNLIIVSAQAAQQSTVLTTKSMVYSILEIPSKLTT